MLDLLQQDLLDFKPEIIYENVINKRYEQYEWESPLQMIAESHLESMTQQEMDKDWGLNDFFGTIAVINLPSSTERLKNVTEELHNIGTTSFTVFEAINGRKDVDVSIWSKFHSNREGYDKKTEEGRNALDGLHQGEAGCYLSHYTLIKRMSESFELAMQELASIKLLGDEEAIQNAEKNVRQYCRVLIFEDDSAFGIIKNKKILRSGLGCVLRKALKELPTKWDMFYLMALTDRFKVKYSPYLYKLKKSACASAYAINHTMYKTLIDQLKKIEDPKVTRILPVDNAISSIHHLHKVFLVSPTLTYQQVGKSEISSKYNNDPWQVK